MQYPVRKWLMFQLSNFPTDIHIYIYIYIIFFSIWNRRSPERPLSLSFIFTTQLFITEYFICFNFLWIELFVKLIINFYVDFFEC